MAGKSPVRVRDDEKAALKALASGADRAEADRARAILLTLAGWTSGRIAEAFSVRQDTVRIWRSDFISGGVEALKARVAPGPEPLKARAPGQAKKVAMMGSLDYARRKLVVTTSRTKRSADFIAHLELLDRLYGPKPGAPFKPVVLVLDNGPIHVSKATLAALAERVHWLVVEWLPKYTLSPP